MKINLAIIGAGRIGKIHARAINNNSIANLVYIYDLDEASAKNFANELLQKANFIVCILTSENSQIVKARAKKLNIKEVYVNEKQKLLRIKYLAEKYNINLDEIAYIGDDINDLEILKSIGLSAMPSSSPILNMINPDIITDRKGGDGAFREFIDHILLAQGITPAY